MKNGSVSCAENRPISPVLLVATLLLAVSAAFAGPFGARHVEAEDLAGVPLDDLGVLVDDEMNVLRAEVELAALKRDLAQSRKKMRKAKASYLEGSHSKKKSERELKVGTAASDQKQIADAEAQIAAKEAALDEARRFRAWKEMDFEVQKSRVEAAEGFLVWMVARRDLARAELISAQELPLARYLVPDTYEAKVKKAEADYEAAVRQTEFARNEAARFRMTYEKSGSWDGAVERDKIANTPDPSP